MAPREAGWLDVWWLGRIVVAQLALIPDAHRGLGLDRAIFRRGEGSAGAGEGFVKQQHRL